ncbi:MAG: NAD(P)H-binding protein [Pseudomonadota bacterium]
MKIILFGARGDVGRRIGEEALARGHDVTAVVRRQAQAGEIPQGAVARVAEVGERAAAARLMAGHDLAITALRPPDGEEPALVPLTGALLDGAALAEIPLLIVGGAASLKLPGQDGETVLSAPGFLPAPVLPIARASFAQYELCLADPRGHWTYVSPPALLTPGERMGDYRIGTDELLFDGAGESRISMEDFAVALIDEAEAPRHRGARFTVAS